MFWELVIAIGMLLTAGYVLLMLAYTRWFGRLNAFTGRCAQPRHAFSVVVPARNEEQNIEKNVRSILGGAYPATLMELIVVDDHSTDRTAEIVEGLQAAFPQLKLLRLADILQGGALNSYKKKAVETAIAHARHEWIVTTDADCFPTPQWLLSLDCYLQQHERCFVAGPVKFLHSRHWFSVFQAIDFLALQGITAASVSAGFHAMCNGANLAYTKTAFYEVKGFEGIDGVASGDDMLLMGKIKARFPEGVGYLFAPEAIVATLPMPDWTAFLNQRIRWASKSKLYTDRTTLPVLWLVYLVNVWLFVAPFLAVAHAPLLGWWLLLFAVKALFESLFLYRVARFFGETRLLSRFFLLQPVHVFYMVVAGWLGNFGHYQWKGRRVA